ncbi:SurA N-terminal domain-containing protein [Bdellovibrio sp. SKB1291214]|uniref:SurA N-terminal domain-containing protein n=1 Tax=Bdellovibrio sp. SKB1291214 TaxID=1732569 RepID=UPI0020CBD099|nr:SurA N-terminal domain-containing protein [Bdellovibrio sp. SKB1291214]UYL07636.1 SurA N-terminal domain-containing protein [Bdellovibrio sp. SKB1291214]
MSENMADKMKRKLNAKSVTAIILFGAIILTFVFMDVGAKMGMSVGSVARVNNALISVGDFQREETRVSEYYKSIFGSQMDFSSQRQLLRQQAIENLIRNELVAQAAHSEGILATDRELADFLTKDIPQFQTNGVFQKEIYRNFLEGNRFTAGDFESKMKKDITNVRARHLFEIVNRTSQAEANKMQELRGGKINVSFVKIEEDALIKAMTKEKAEAAIKALDEALTKGDEAAVNAQLKEMKAGWEETGLVELGADQFPKITSKVATESVFELTKAQPLLKRLVRDGNSKYVLKLKEVKMEGGKALEPMTLEMAQKRRGDGMFEAWVNQFRKNSHLTMNKQVLEM